MLGWHPPNTFTDAIDTELQPAIELQRKLKALEAEMIDLGWEDLAINAIIVKSER